MTERKPTQSTAEVADTNLEPRNIPLNEPIPTANDPGGAHVKGYSADPKPEAKVETEGPIPLAEVPKECTGVRVSERDSKVHPTGRSEPQDYTPNDRLMGSDR
jgi:hypothetical protein